MINKYRITRCSPNKSMLRLAVTILLQLEQFQSKYILFTPQSIYMIEYPIKTDLMYVLTLHLTSKKCRVVLSCFDLINVVSQMSALNEQVTAIPCSLYKQTIASIKSTKLIQCMMDHSFQILKRNYELINIDEHSSNDSTYICLKVTDIHTPSPHLIFTTRTQKIEARQLIAVLIILS